MRKILFLAILMVALVAVPSFASVQNIKVSGSVDSAMLSRDNFDLGASTTGNDDAQNIFFTKTRLSVEADLTDNVAATVSLINERVWNVTNSSNTDIDLNEAYVTLREMLYSPLTVIIGRQNLSYGNSLIVDSAALAGNSSLNDVATDLSDSQAMDAVRVILDYNPLTLELMYAMIDENVANISGDPQAEDDVNLFGVNATYELGDDMDTQVEAYFFAKMDKSTGKADGANDGSKDDTIYVPGVRVSMNVLDGLNIQAEYAHQSGTKSSTTVSNQQSRSANALQFMADYSLPLMEDYDPTLQYAFTFVSGDSDSSSIHNGGGDNSDENWTAWDPFFEYQGTPKIYNALFNLTNMQIHTVTLEAKPMEDVTTALSWTGLWLDKELNQDNDLVLNQPDGSTAGAATVAGKTALGNEIDVSTLYDYTEDVQFGATVGYFIPGSVFSSDNKDAASQAMVNCKVNF